MDGTPAIRFLGLMRQPNENSDRNSVELDESDIVWSTAFSPPADRPDYPPADRPDYPPADRPDYPPVPVARHRLRHEKFGLSAALCSDEAAVRWRPRLDRSVSSARAIPSVQARSGDGSPGENLMQSAPIKVPVWPTAKAGIGGGLRRSGLGRFGVFDNGGDEWVYCEDGIGDEEMLPPHELVERAQKKATFSVVEGAGRTLKGRDLRRVRNAVWQQTGFLD